MALAVVEKSLVGRGIDRHARILCQARANRSGCARAAHLRRRAQRRRTFFFVSDGAVADDFARADSGGTFGTSLGATRVGRGEAVTVWFVLRDDRGGVDWAVRTFTAR